MWLSREYLSIDHRATEHVKLHSVAQILCGSLVFLVSSDPVPTASDPDLLSICSDSPPINLSGFKPLKACRLLTVKFGGRQHLPGLSKFWSQLALTNSSTCTIRSLLPLDCTSICNGCRFGTRGDQLERRGILARNLTGSCHLIPVRATCTSPSYTADIQSESLLRRLWRWLLRSLSSSGEPSRFDRLWPFLPSRSSSRRERCLSLLP